MEDEFEKRIRNVCKSIRMVADAEVAKAPVKKFSDKRIEDFFTQFYGLSYEPKQMVVDLPGPLFLPDGEFQVAALTLPAGVDPDSVLVMAYTKHPPGIQVQHIVFLTLSPDGLSLVLTTA